jgi:hypothetical protein
VLVARALEHNPAVASAARHEAERRTAPPARAPFVVTAVNADGVSDSICCVCTKVRANVVIVPCGHLSLCRACSEEMRVRASNDGGIAFTHCPQCRGAIERIIPCIVNVGDPTQ